MSVINTVKKSVILSGIELDIWPELRIKEEFHESMIPGKVSERIKVLKELLWMRSVFQSEGTRIGNVHGERN